MIFAPPKRLQTMPGAKPAAPMSPAQIAVKLEQIRHLTLADIEGWRQIGLARRAPFEGELAALAQRERELRNAR